MPDLLGHCFAAFFTGRLEPMTCDASYLLPTLQLLCSFLIFRKPARRAVNLLDDAYGGVSGGVRDERARPQREQG